MVILSRIGTQNKTALRLEILSSDAGLLICPELEREDEAASRRGWSALGLGRHISSLPGVPRTPEGGIAPLVHPDSAALSAVKARPRKGAARGRLRKQSSGLDGGQAAGYLSRQGSKAAPWEFVPTRDAERGGIRG